MSVTIEDLSSVKKILHIEVPAETAAREIEKAYAQLKKTAKIKGFRPGKAPRGVLERLYNKDVQADVTSRLIQDSFVSAVTENDLKIVGNPQIDPPPLNINSPYKYAATVEVKPELGAIEFKDLPLKKTLYHVTDEAVDTQIQMLRKNLAQLKKVEKKRSVKDGDYVLVDYEGLKEGKPFAETARTENFTMKIGSGSISKDLDDQMVGMNPGDEKEIKVKFGDDHFNKNLAGQEIDFQVTLKEIREEELPEVNDAFAKKLGKYENLDELKAAIVENLKQGYDKRVEQELNEQAFSALIEKKDFEVPEVMVEYELENIIADAQRSFAYHNVSMEDLGLTQEKLKERYQETAVKQVKRHLVLSRIVEQENLSLSDEALEKAYQDMAAGLNQTTEDVKRYYQQNKDNLEFFKQALLEKQAMKLIIESSKIEEVEPAADEVKKAGKKTDKKGKK
ncbi:MAG: trigger factor [Thermodesulfobacteriota bacterium]